jgi:hypothetical protein
MFIVAVILLVAGAVLDGGARAKVMHADNTAELEGAVKEQAMAGQLQTAGWIFLGIMVVISVIIGGMGGKKGEGRRWKGMPRA